MKIPLICAVLALTGCAAASIDQLRSQTPYQSELTLCENAILSQGPISMVSREELNRRGANCNEHMAAIAAIQDNNARQAAHTAQQANNTQQLLLGLQLLQAAQPQPMYPMPMPAQSVICTSRPGAGGLTTVCQ